jgi:LEA14-like dessication related protein
MNPLKTLILAGGLGIIGYSLYRYYKKQVDFLKNITYQIYDVKIISISKTKVTLTIWAKIYNASNVDAVVKEMFLDFFINGVKVGNVTEEKDIKISPMQTNLINFNFSFDPSILGKNIVDLVSLSLKAKDIVFNLNGYVAVESGGIKATLPFEYKNNLNNLIKK